ISKTVPFCEDHKNQATKIAPPTSPSPIKAQQICAAIAKRSKKPCTHAALPDMKYCKDHLSQATTKDAVVKTQTESPSLPPLAPSPSVADSNAVRPIAKTSLP